MAYEPSIPNSESVFSGFEDCKSTPRVMEWILLVSVKSLGITVYAISDIVSSTQDITGITAECIVNLSFSSRIINKAAINVIIIRCLLVNPRIAAHTVKIMIYPELYFVEYCRDIAEPII